MTAAWNYLNLSLQKNETEKAFLQDTNASLQSLMENYKAEMNEKKEGYQRNYLPTRPQDFLVVGRDI